MPTVNWPLKSGESGAQTSGLVQAVKAGEGAIGYADDSQAGDLGVAKVKVGNTYVAPSAEGASARLRQVAEGSGAQPGKYVFAYKVERTSTDPSDYPLLLVSWLMGCTKYNDAATTDLVKAYFNFVISDDGSAGGGGARRLGADRPDHQEARTRRRSMRSGADRDTALSESRAQD